MKKLYIVTGACGHLGGTIIRLLLQQKEQVRGLILPTEKKRKILPIDYVEGDMRDKTSLLPLFKDIDDYDVIVIHTAGIIDISDEISQMLYDVNVQGTKNIIELCRNYNIKRMVYVSSVHAIPEKESLQVIEESDHFSADEVHGGYAKTKAIATALVLAAVKEGLDAVIVHPSGILGPYDESLNHLVQMVDDYQKGRLPACVKGGYDFVDVRDVAMGCLSAAINGKKGECYILANRHYELEDLFKMIREVHGGKKVPTLPLWLARVAVPFIEWEAKRKNIRPLYTNYSLYTLSSNDRFSHDKATKELNYHPRDLYLTIKDTLDWLNK